MLKILKDRLELLDIVGLKDKWCAEIGVFKGEFAHEIHVRNPRHLFLIDPWKNQDPRDYHDINNHKQDAFEEIYQSVVDKFRVFDNVDLLRMDSYKAFRHLVEEKIALDFVYIDGNHGYPYVLGDLLMYSSLMSEGGYICGHDYKSTFVGVQMAVDAFCQMTGYEVEFETADAPWKSFCIKVK